MQQFQCGERSQTEPPGNETINFIGNRDKSKKNRRSPQRQCTGPEYKSVVQRLQDLIILQPGIYRGGGGWGSAYAGSTDPLPSSPLYFHLHRLGVGKLWRYISGCITRLSMDFQHRLGVVVPPLPYQRRLPPPAITS